jgi:soluble lytic murein transglycosylase-like protein
MLEDLGAIQARISEIEGRLASLAPPAPPAIGPGVASLPSFSQTLQRTQTPAGAPLPLRTAGNETRGVTVPPAALGPLPPLPVTPNTTHLIPIVHQAGTGQYASLIQTYADKHGLAPALVKAVIQTESGGNPHAVSPAGAMGLMQLMPSNVQEAGISDPFDPEQNIAAGTEQLSGLMKQYGGNLDLTLAGYNAGPGNVRKYGGIPPFSETQNYIRKVRAAMEHGGA